MRRVAMAYRQALFVVLALAFAAVTSIAAQKAEEPTTIEIVGIPPAGQGGPGPTAEISGKASGPDLRNLRVVVYAYAGDQWWVQPTAANPLTPIDVSSGKWETDTHLGRTYAALLVRRTYKPAATTASLPETGGDVLASDTVAGKR
jgi:hypothetical protein